MDSKNSENGATVVIMLMTEMAEIMGMVPIGTAALRMAGMEMSIGNDDGAMVMIMVSDN